MEQVPSVVVVGKKTEMADMHWLSTALVWK